MFEFKFPDVGEGITEGRLIKWLRAVGDTIKEDDPVAEIETDKSVVELPTPKSGRITQLLYKEGDILNVGKTILILDGEGTTQGTAQVTATRQETVTQLQNSITTTASKNRQTGILALPNVRKAAAEKGINLSIVKGSGKDGRILLSDIGGMQKDQPTIPTIPTSGQVTQPVKDIIATPSTRKLARELGVDISTITGTGKAGLITAEDVTNSKNKPAAKAINSTITSAMPGEITTEHLSAKPTGSQIPNQTRVPMSMLRLAIANKMTASHANTTSVTHTDEADMTDLVLLREKEKQILSARGIKLTYLPFFMKAALIGLKSHPNVNAEIDMDKREIILKNYYNIGFAADTSQGLLVPVIAHVDKKSIIDMATEIDTLAEKAKTGKLTADEMRGSTFTITSVGNIGGLAFTPIINYPEVAILGIGKIQERPVVRSGQIVIRKIAILSLTYDHRLIDGADAARFLNTIITHLEDPSLLFMEL